MEVTRLSSRGVSSFLCCPSLSNATPVSALGASSCSVRSSQLGASSPSSSSPYRSSIWSAAPLGYGRNLGAVTLLLLAQKSEAERRGRRGRNGRNGRARAYLENKNPVLKFLSKVQGSLPVVGLISRLLSPEGGVGADRIRFEEFCTRVGRNCTMQDSSAFYKMAAKYGKNAKAPYLLIWCWAAALGAGLLRSEDLLMGASRLRVSYDLQFEVENFDLLMDEATKKREKSGSQLPDVPMESRAEKALEAMCICCTKRKDIAEEDAPLFSTILKVVFPTADKEQIDLIVAARIFDPFTPNPADSVEKSLDVKDGLQEDENNEEVDEQELAAAVDDEQGEAELAAVAEQQEALPAAAAAEGQPQSVVHELLQ